MKTFPIHFRLFLLLLSSLIYCAVNGQDLPNDFVEKVRAEYNSISQEVKNNELQLTFGQYLNRRIDSYRSRQQFYSELQTSTTAVHDLCANGTFENGEITTSDWSFYWEGDNAAFSGTNRVNAGSFNSGGPHGSQVHHQAVPVAPDTYFSGVGELDQVWTFPTGNTYSLRLGNANPRWGLESVAKKIVVSPSSSVLSFSYAIVTDNPVGHGSALPFFEVNIIDAGNSTVNYNSLVNLGNSSNRISSDNPLLIPNNPSASRRWKDWTCVTADLSSLIGDTVIIEFVNRDCWAGAHWAYAYLDNLCLSCEGAPGDEGSISINRLESDTCGIPGQICIDYTLANGDSSSLDLTLEIIQNGVTINTLMSPTLSTAGTYCFNLSSADTMGLNPALGGFDFKVTGYPSIGAFSLSPQIIGNSSTGYLPGSNNDYTIDCPGICGEIIRDTIGISCENPQSIPYTFSFTNHSGMPVTSLLITDVSPSGTTISPSSFNLFFSPVPDGGTYGPITTQINLPNPISKATEVCFTVKYISEGEVCCSYLHCLTILPPDPCQWLKVNLLSPGVDPGTDCCYELSLSNNFCPDYFTSIMTEVITPGVVFGSYDGGSTWTGTPSTNGQFINWLPADGGPIPMGTLSEMRFCLDSIDNVSQLPQEVVIHWMRGDKIICSDTLQFRCNPCAFITINEVVCNEDGTVTFNYTLFNTSGQPVQYFYFEVHDSTVQFIPSMVNQSIPTGGIYNGSITLAGVGSGGLSAGTPIPFKLVLFGPEDWCCHMEGLSLTIPDCTEDCECGNEEDWQKLFDVGYSAIVDCESGRINFTTSLSACDTVVFSIYDAASLQVLATGSGSGDQVVSLPLLPNGAYLVEFSAVRYNANGEPCFTATERFDLNIDCPSDACDCNDEAFFDALNAGLFLTIDCEKGVVRAATQLTDCDTVVLRIQDENNQLVFDTVFAGNLSVEFPVLPNGTYSVQMLAYRRDFNGEICLQSSWQGQITIDCSADDCCGSQADFLAVIQAGYQINFNCDEANNGPEVTFSALAATECDQIEWQLLDAEGNVLVSATTQGSNSVSFNLSALGNFTLLTSWNRINQNGESCFGLITRLETIINPCALNAGPITVSLMVKRDQTVTVLWEVDPEASYEEYVIVREDKEDTQVIASVLAEAGRRLYRYEDKKPLDGRNKYMVFGFIQDQEAGRSDPRQVQIHLESRPEIRIIPNPLVQFAVLSLNQAGTYELQVSDQLGRVYHRNRIYLPANLPHQIDLKDYPAGLLLIQVINERGEAFTRRVIKLSQ